MLQFWTMNINEFLPLDKCLCVTIDGPFSNLLSSYFDERGFGTGVERMPRDQEVRIPPGAGLFSLVSL